MSAVSVITEEMLASLREAIKPSLSPKRYKHTLAVEEEAKEIAKLYLPQNITEIRAAALLHDITKECTSKEQIALCRRYGLPVTDVDLASPKIFHAKTAAAVVADRFPLYATDEVLDAIAKHTTGAKEMSLFAKILYLADYTEKTRTFEDCLRLRSFFWEKPIANMTEEERLMHLDRTLLLSFDMTIACLIRDGEAIAPETTEARNALVLKFSKHT